MQPPRLSAHLLWGEQSETTARFFEEGRSAIIVALGSRPSASTGSVRSACVCYHMLGVGSRKGFEYEVAGYKLSCRATLTTSWIVAGLDHSPQVQPLAKGHCKRFREVALQPSPPVRCTAKLHHSSCANMVGIDGNRFHHVAALIHGHIDTEGAVGMGA